MGRGDTHIHTPLAAGSLSASMPGSLSTHLIIPQIETPCSGSLSLSLHINQHVFYGEQKISNIETSDLHIHLL